MEGNLMNQNDRQVGGDHYKKLEIQTWDYIIANNKSLCFGADWLCESCHANIIGIINFIDSDG